MVLKRLTAALSCTLSVASIQTRRALWRTAMLAGLFSMWTLSSANANPIGIQFSSTLGFGPLAGTPVWGSFFWNDPGPGPTMAPVSALTVNVGSRQFGLSQGLYPAYVVNPHFDPSSGFANSWGPSFALRPEFMFGGLTHFGLFQGGAVFVAYSYSPSTPVQYLTQAQVALVPGPSSFLLCMAGLAGIWVCMRAGSHRTRTRS